MDFLEATFRQKPLAHWMDVAGHARHLLRPGQHAARGDRDPNLLKRGMIVTDGDGRKHFAPVVRFRNEPSHPLYREPLLGEHTEEILRR